jgi:IclR-like helix-turn-helix domain-containing protein
MINTIEHAGSILALFSAERPEWGATSAARALGVSKSGAHNLLVSLASIGLLRRVPAGQYRLGWRALEMADTIGSTDELIAAATPVMRQLVRACGHPVALGAGADGLVIALTDERGTHVGGISWFPRTALREALSLHDPQPRPVIVREAQICHVAMEIDHGRPALRLAIGTLLPLARADRSRWIAVAAARIGHALRKNGCPFSTGEQPLLSGAG